MVVDINDLAYNSGNFFSDELLEAKRFFEWALAYERKGLALAADALREEGRKAYDRYLEMNPE
jgi:hypothetical protein